MKKFIIISFTLLLISCDFIDEDLKVINNENENFYITLIIEEHDLSKESFLIPPTLISETSRLKLLNRHWVNIFNYTDSLHVVFIKENKLNNYTLNDSMDELSKTRLKNELLYTTLDSLLRLGDYEFKNYGKSDLKYSNWTITYPDDGFKKGNER